MNRNPSALPDGLLIRRNTTNNMNHSINDLNEALRDIIGAAHNGQPYSAEELNELFSKYTLDPASPPKRQYIILKVQSNTALFFNKNAKGKWALDKSEATIFDDLFLCKQVRGRYGKEDQTVCIIPA